MIVMVIWQFALFTQQSNGNKKCQSNLFTSAGTRFRFVTSVTIGEKKQQDVRVGSRCLWDTTRDSCASANYENLSLFATAVIYAIYLE